MKCLSVPEYGRIARSWLGDKLTRRLQVFDQEHAKTAAGCIFDWSREDYIQATNYVGVVQVPGLLVEILPKIDTSANLSPGPFEDRGELKVRAQDNLLYMLSLTRKIPIRDRDLAGLRLQKMPLLEALVAIFIERLFAELRKGLDHAYVRREENLRHFKGKLLVSRHIRHNAAHEERMFVAYDDFVADTALNRILKAGCRRLLSLVSLARTQRRLREAILYFADVKDCRIEDQDFAKLQLNRNTERFEPLVDFCRIVLAQKVPAPRQGPLRTFSLLFPMEVLFEEFIARFIWRYSEALRLDRRAICIQAARHRRWLLRDINAPHTGRFRTKPDILIRRRRATQLILDTKWKHLKSDREDSRNGVSQADLYQLYAYAHRYESPDNVLLYPKVYGVTAKGYLVAGEEGKRVRIEFIDLNRDLRKNRLAVVADLQRVLSSQDNTSSQLA